MKASRFTEAQKAFILQQGRDGMPVAEVCRKAGISQATYFNWKKKYDGLLPTEMRRLKRLEDENTKLRKVVADLYQFGLSEFYGFTPEANVRSVDTESRSVPTTIPPPK